MRSPAKVSGPRLCRRLCALSDRLLWQAGGTGKYSALCCLVLHRLSALTHELVCSNTRQLCYPVLSCLVSYRFCALLHKLPLSGTGNSRILSTVIQVLCADPRSVWAGTGAFPIHFDLLLCMLCELLHGPLWLKQVPVPCFLLYGTQVLCANPWAVTAVDKNPFLSYPASYFGC